MSAPSRERSLPGRVSKTGLALLALLGVLAAAGCRENEQGRTLDFKKGQYQGQADQKLSDDDQKALRQRAELQK
jgi:hypothetical protein